MSRSAAHEDAAQPEDLSASSWSEPTPVMSRAWWPSTSPTPYWPFRGATVEVARRQPDGTWLWVLDQPNILG
jgi:hypothetical protein